MSILAAPRCCRFVPQPGTEQLALLKGERQFFKRSFVMVSWQAAGPIYGFLPFCTPLLSQPHQTKPLFTSPTSVFLLLANQHAQPNQGVTFSSASCLLLPLTCQQTAVVPGQAAAKGNKQGAINIGGAAAPKIHHAQSYKFNLVNCQSMPSTPGTMQDIQPTWLNSISQGDGQSRAHLPRNHIIAAWVNRM